MRHLTLTTAADGFASLVMDNADESMNLVTDEFIAEMTEAAALVAATRSARAVGVYELNAGQMIDDVRLSLSDRPITFIGGISFDDSGFGIAPELTPAKVEQRIMQAMAQARAEMAA